MAQDYLTLTELAKINDFNVTDVGMSDLLNDAPLLRLLAAETATNGVTHKYVKETGAPVVGFRAINDGVETDKSEDTAVTITLKLLDASFGVDMALADSFRGNRSVGGGREAYIAREARRHMRAAFFHAEKQFIYGTGNDSDGFDGLAHNAAFDKKDDTMVVDAGGTTANTGSSVWLIRTNAMGTDMQAIIGNDGKIVMDETVKVKADGSSTGHYTQLWTPIQGWLGLQIGSAYSVVRICNLTADSGKGLTDDLLAEAISKFPASRGPSHIVMNRRSLKQLQQSRTATNATGAPAPFPSESFGVPIVTTDAIVSTEALLAASI